MMMMMTMMIRHDDDCVPTVGRGEEVLGKRRRRQCDFVFTMSGGVDEKLAVLLCANAYCVVLCGCSFLARD